MLDGLQKVIYFFESIVESFSSVIDMGKNMANTVNDLYKILEGSLPPMLIAELGVLVGLFVVVFIVDITRDYL